MAHVGALAARLFVLNPCRPFMNGSLNPSRKTAPFRYVAYRTFGRAVGYWRLYEETTMRKAVLIADDNAFVRTALYEFFQREPDFVVCGVAENGLEAVEEALRLHPDVVVLDMTMPVMNGMEAARLLKHEMPQVPLIMYSSAEDEATRRAARLAGVAALVPKSHRVSALIQAARGLVQQKAA